MCEVADGVVTLLQAAKAAAGGSGGQTDGVSASAVRRHRYVLQHHYLHNTHTQIVKT